MAQKQGNGGFRCFTKRNKGNGWSLACLGVSALYLTTACAFAQAESGDETGETAAKSEDNLYGLGSLATRWSGGKVPVCFASYSPDDPRVNKIRWILTDTWSAAAKISFTGFGACSGSGNRITVAFGDVNYRGSSDMGQGKPVVTLMSNDNVSTIYPSGAVLPRLMSRFRYEVMHEFGHALGFAHEQTRPDNWTYDGAGNPLTSIGCPANPNDLAQWLPQNGGLNLTAAYDPNSVMGYCSHEPGTNFYPQNLSSGDIAGASSSAAYGVAPARPRTKRGILWRNQNDGTVVEWHMTGTSYSTTAIPTEGRLAVVRDANLKYQGSGDFDGDGIGDVLWRNSDGSLTIWFLNSGSIRAQGYPGAPSNDWKIYGIGDFNGDGRSDILWRHSGGQVAIWWSGSLNGASYPGGTGGSEWSIQGVGDFDGDHKSDILWRTTAGQLAVWSSGDATKSYYPPLISTSWVIKGVGDFNGDGKDDILWRYTTGQVAVWPSVLSSAGAWYPGGDGDNSWSIVGVGDFDSDGKSDVLWRLFSGQMAIWWGATGPQASAYPGGDGDNTWQPLGTLLDLAY